MAELEATCARLSAISRTSIERRRLGGLHGRMGAMVERGEESTYIEANVAFHTAICAGAHNTIITEIATGLRRRLMPFRRAQFRMQGRLALSHAEHHEVVAAVSRGDSAAHAKMLTT